MGQQHFSKFEREVIRFIKSNPVKDNDKTLGKLMVKVFGKFLPEIGIVIKSDKILIRYFSTESYTKKWEVLVDKKVSMSFKNRLRYFFDRKTENDRRRLIKSKILTIKFLFERLCQEKFIIELNSKVAPDQVEVVSRHSIKQVEEVKVDASDFVKLSKCDYLIDESLFNLVKARFLSLDNRNLKITQFALYFTIGLSLISFIPDSEECFINNTEVRVRTAPINTKNNENVTSFLNYGESIEVVKDSAQYCLVKYKTGTKNKYGWVSKSYISSIGILEKLFSSIKLFYFFSLVIVMIFFYLKIFKI